MFKSYFKIGWRNLLRNRGYSFINIIGLTVGMTVAILIGMWVLDEITANANHTNYNRIAQVYQNQVVNNEINTVGAAPIPLAAELRNAYKSDFRHVVNVWWESDHVLSREDKKIPRNGTFMDEEGLEMFSFEMVKGSWGSLRHPSSIILAEATAIALFGNEDPINQSLKIDNTLDVKVTGIYREMPFNSRFHALQFVSTWDLWLSSNDWMKADENNWSTDVSVFVEIQPAANFQDVSSKIAKVKFNKLSREQAEKDNPELFLHPMSRWHLYSQWKNGQAAGGRIQFVWLFGIIGSFVLILACINFVNLSTAQSEKRAKEVGIRKSIGSARGQLINQFLVESLIVVTFAFIVAMGLATLCMPWFNDLADKNMSLPWGDPTFLVLSLGFILLTSVLAGSYPALFLSSFQPVKVLKGTFKAGRFANVPRKVLVVLQFSFSVVLIIGTIIVWQQIQFAKNRPVGYTRNGLIMIRKNAPDFWGKFEAIRNGLKASDAIVEIAESSSPATQTWFNNSEFNWKGKNPNSKIDFAVVAVTHDYGKTMGWKFLQGRDFSRDYSTDSSAVVLNETAARMTGLKDPIHEEILWNNKKLTVIGVIQDMIIDSPYEPVKQTIFGMSYAGNVWINIRLNPALSTHEAISRIENVFRSILPAVPFDFKFTDQEYNIKFAAEERIGKLAAVFAALAIFISCMGLFGLSSFIAGQRTKEIGLRKIMGATVFNLWKMLTKDFAMLVVISVLISIPVAYYLMSSWLQKYEYRTDINVWVFAVSGAGAFLITLLTVSYQSISVALANPVKSLRSE